MKRTSYVFQLLILAVLATSLVVSGCSVPFDLGLERTNNTAEILDAQTLAENQQVANALEDVKMSSLAPVSEFDSVESTMRIMEQSLFRPSLEEKEQISEITINYLTQLAEVDYQTVTGREGLELIYPSSRLGIKDKSEELVKYYQDHQLVFALDELEADFVIVTPLGARARVIGKLSQKGNDVRNFEKRTFHAFFYLKKLQDQWYIEKAPTLKSLAEMNLLSENDEQQIKELLHSYVYATMHWDYHTVSGKEGFDYLAPPLFNDQILTKLAAEKVKNCQENEWVQTVNNMISYFIHGTPEEANAVVAGTFDRSGKTGSLKNNPFEGHFGLKKVDNEWRISNIKKYEE